MVARGFFCAWGGWDEDALVDVPMAAVAGDARGHCIEHKRVSSGRVGLQRVSFGRGGFCEGVCETALRQAFKNTRETKQIMFC